MLATRKWIALTLGGLVLIVSFGALSWWQWQRAQRDQVDTPVVAADTVFPASGPMSADHYGARVRVAGRYDAAHQVLVAHPNAGYWIVTPLQRADGASVPVARGYVRSATDPAVVDVTSGEVSVVGYAQPYEGDPGTPSSLPPGQIERLTEAGLAVPYAVTPGWVALQSQLPAPTVAVTPVDPPVGGAAPAPLRLQNASYALQWLAFAGFVVFFWWRALRDDVSDAAGAAPPEAVAPVREVY
jgi:cytochrome oxidase assembly protein ShyY1